MRYPLLRVGSVCIFFILNKIHTYIIIIDTYYCIYILNKGYYLMNNIVDNVTKAINVATESNTSVDFSHINSKDINSKGQFIVTDKDVLKNIVKSINVEADLNCLDVSNVTDMSYMFQHSQFNGDISKWDVGNVKNMSGMFQRSRFSGDISKWDVSNVENMFVMFQHSRFNGDISKWDVSNVVNMSRMFNYSRFNGDISNWNVNSVRDMSNVFSNSKFNTDISKWDVSNVSYIENMFSDVTCVNNNNLKLAYDENDIINMFNCCSFKKPIDNETYNELELIDCYVSISSLI